MELCGFIRLAGLPVTRHPDRIPGNKESGQSFSFTASRNVMHARKERRLSLGQSMHYLFDQLPMPAFGGSDATQPVLFLQFFDISLNGSFRHTDH